LKNTGVAITIGLGNSENLHPQDKYRFTDNIYSVLDRVVYFGDANFTGPLMSSVKKEGKKIFVAFNYAVA